MGTPGMSGKPATSAAQHAEKTFPAGTDPASITQVSGLPAAEPVATGTPVTPEIRQVRDPADMGLGYREAPDGTPR